MKKELFKEFLEEKKSEMEKQAILNSFKLFFKTCDFDFQILIQVMA